MPDLAFQWHPGLIEGPTVFRQYTERSGDLDVSWLIVGASHLVHYRTPWGEWTEAIADPTRLPPGARFETPLAEQGTFQDQGFSITWQILPWDEALLEKAQSFPLTHDFGEGALTALSWRWDEGLTTETFHAYPEERVLVHTLSRVRV